MNEPSKSDLQLKALAELPDTIKIGEKDYTIYALSMGKIVLLAEKLESIMGLVAMWDKTKDVTDGDFASQIKKSTGDVSFAFLIITQPNVSTGVIIPTEADLEAIKWVLTINDILQIMLIIKKQASFQELLKNLADRKEKSSVGENS